MTTLKDWFIFYILSILQHISSTASIISIGVHIAPTNDSESTDNTTITLYWHNDKIQCTFIPSSYGQWYGCNTTTFHSYITNCTSSQYKMHITIPLNDGVWIDEIRIYDDNNNTYYYNQFCSSLIFPFWSHNETNCTNYPYPIWPIFCIGTDCNNYNALNLDLSHFQTEETLVTLSSSIPSDMCSINTLSISTTEDTDNPPLPGITAPFLASSPTTDPTLNPLDISSTINVVDTTSNITNNSSLNIMDIIIPALLITVCLCFVGVILFFICSRKKQNNKNNGNRKHKKLSSHKHTQIQMQSSTSTQHNGSPVVINNNPSQILIHHNSNNIGNNNNNNDNNHNMMNTETMEHSSSSSSSIENIATTNTENEGISKGMFLDSENMNGFKIGHKVTFDSTDIGVNSLPASPLQPPQSEPMVPPIINIKTIHEVHEIISNHDSDSSLYKKQQHQYLDDDINKKEYKLQTTKGGNTPNTPETPGNDD